jgi:hypothetical protein
VLYKRKKPKRTESKRQPRTSRESDKEPGGHRSPTAAAGAGPGAKQLLEVLKKSSRSGAAIVTERKRTSLGDYRFDSRQQSVVGQNHQGE